MLASVILAVVFAAQSVEAPDTFADHAWWQFSRNLSLIGGSETVDMALGPKDSSTQKLSYIMRLKRRRGSGPVEMLWADSRMCPAVRSVLGAMRRLAVPYPVVEGMEPEAREIIMDGVSYHLRTRARFARGADDIMDLQSNVGTPLADWIDDSFKALERCWLSTRPLPPE